MRLFTLLGILFLSYAAIAAEAGRGRGDTASDTGTTAEGSVSPAQERVDSVFIGTKADEKIKGVDFPVSESGDSASATRAADSLLLRSSTDSAGRVATLDYRIPGPVRPSWLYQGLTLEQDTLARQLMKAFLSFDWNGAEKTGKRMQRLEKRHHLPPLSNLLLVGMHVIRIQNSEYEEDRDARELLRDVAKLSSRGLELADPHGAPDSCRAIRSFITGGLKGFLATLDIDRNPVNAAIAGFSAQKFLAEALALDSSLNDAYLGIGLFNCILAKAPLIIQGALTLIGRDVSLARGLDYLRRSAYNGCYTKDIARLYLAQFLSPYLGHEAGEKRKIFQAMQNVYSSNPYYVFMELEEDICFNPGMLVNDYLKSRVRQQIARFKTTNYSTRRYANLVKWQYRLMDHSPPYKISPDTSYNLRGFSYYPVFLQAVREKLLFERENLASRNDGLRRMRYIRILGIKASRSLELSPDMPLGRKTFFLWHIRDALGFEKEIR
ncbi:MAG: hypothetical protein JXA71_07050 [Chitinispirillaceae bacterium]|nr:hypothetical protein [Chitinispirillaceae bacterium]